MEDDLKQFLRSRDVPDEDIMRMQRDKVDKAVLSVMTDEQIAKYITSYGDRVATLFYCQQTKTSADKETLLQNLRDKIGARKMKSKARRPLCGSSFLFHQENESMSRQRNNAAEKTSRKIEIGWLHLSCNEYHQVRTNLGGGTRHVTVEKTTTVAQILDIGKGLFFPDGHSTKGGVEDFNFDVRDYKRNQIPFDDTVGKLYEQTKLKLLRFYICTKEASSTDQSSSEVEGCSDNFLSEGLPSSIAEGEDSQVAEHGPQSDAGVLITDQPDHGHSSDSDISEQRQRFQRKRRSRRQRVPSETAMVQGQRDLLPFHSTPTNIKTTHIGQGPGTNSSDDDKGEKAWNELQPSSDVHDFCYEINVLTSAGPVNTDAPEGDEADTVEWDPEDGVAGTYSDDSAVIIFNHNNNEDVSQGAELIGVPVLDLQLPLLSANGLPVVHMLSSDEEVVQSEQEDSRLLPQDLTSSSQPSPLTSVDNPVNPSPRRASICRVKVVEDLLAVFMDSSIINLTLKMDFVNEKAIDDAGVSREVYTAFWEQFNEHCEGETERVPRLRPDYSEDEWQAVGRIWVKGFLDYGVIPVKLSKAFILACIHGIDSVNADILMTSFQSYLPPIERSAVEKALQGTMEESDEEDLLDLFTRMGSHVLPSKSYMEPAIETMAHKSILQEPKFIIDCFSTPMEHVKLKLPDKESVMSLYESKKATGRRVSQLFETTKMVLSQREQATFNHLQRYVKNADQSKAEKILRFCSGSSVMCVEKIMVCFNAETGLNRRPVAHTCGATLELPCTYSAYPEFRTEFDNILSSNYFEMDIL